MGRGKPPNRKRKAARIRHLSERAPDHRTIRRRVTPGGVQKNPWVAPHDMEDWQAKLIVEGKMCGAAKSTGGYCKNRPAPYQEVMNRPKPHRCAFHGGILPFHLMTDEARRAMSLRKRKHGIYAHSIMPGEEDEFEQMRKDPTVNDEIAICKLRLKRAVEEEYRISLGESEGEATNELEYQVTTITQGPEGVTRSQVTRTTPKQIKRMIHRIIIELSKLIKAQADLEGVTAVDPGDAARQAREFLREARSSVTGNTPPGKRRKKS